MQTFTFDFWTIVGILAQGFFLGRFLLQWYLSERQKEVVIPNSFWILSLVGAVLLLLYALARRDVVFLITALLQFALYGRNLMLAKK